MMVEWLPVGDWEGGLVSEVYRLEGRKGLGALHPDFMAGTATKGA